MTTVLLLLPQGGLRRWHKNLLGILARDGIYASIDWRMGAQMSSGVALLDQLEQLLLARGRIGLMQPEEPGEWLRLSFGPADLVFDLSGRAEPEKGAIFPIFCGLTGDAARDLMLLSDSSPKIGLAKSEEGRLLIVAEALIALENPSILQCGRDAVASRLTTLIRALANRSALAAKPMADAGIAPASTSAAAFLARSLAARVRSKLTGLVAHQNHWRVAWRRCISVNDSVHGRLDWPEHDGWTFLEDDGGRYFADPFLFEHEGAVHLFCEEYSYATRKGVLSHVQLDAAGRAVSAPRVILEHAVHLSYPLVFHYNGQIWMMPESSAARTLELYRADPFPYRWTLDSIPMDNIAIADATIFEHDGRYWLSAATSEDEGSSWDCLSLFVGSSPLGPWSRCGKGPVLIDASCARPAGHVFMRAGALWRPAQDCTQGYGSGLALCRLDLVDESGLRQSVMRRLGAPRGSSGVHTLNAAAGIETIDVVGPRSKRRR
ncbi:MAG: hypothetical protein WAN43_12695 [Rhodomicrobium sp.]